MDSNLEASVRAPDKLSTPIVREAPNHALLARLVIREGKPFNVSALQAGYSQSIANGGLKALLAKSKPASDAIERESALLTVSIDKLKPFAVSRLYREIVDPHSPNAMKAIELAGRFKETDWFVRNSDVQLGVFLNMTESAPSTTIEQVDTFQE